MSKPFRTSLPLHVEPDYRTRPSVPQLLAAIDGLAPPLLRGDDDIGVADTALRASGSGA